MARRIPLIANDFKITTWLMLGAFLESLIMLFLPVNFAVKVPSILIGLQLITTYLKTKGFFGASSAILRGRWIARRSDNSTKKDLQGGIVLFVLGARTLHPMGRLAKGFKESRSVFADMWDDAETNRHKFGYLGRSEPLISDSDDGMNIVWLTYWRDLEGLRSFAAGDAHRRGWDAYLSKEFPNLGIMHETYHAPNGNWENIYHSWPAFGLGATTLQHNENNVTLMEAKSPQDNTLFSRMGRV